MSDFLVDNEWNLELIRPSESDTILSERQDSLSERLDGSDEASSIVFRQLDERKQILSDLYPFEISGDLIEFGRNVDREASTYVAVLALTIAHAFNVTSPSSPKFLFEQTVTGALRERGLSSVGVAAIRRQCGNFEEALRTACSMVGLKAAPESAVRLDRAHDEKVDVLCHFGWEQDLRPGTWGFIGQVTVGRSDTWTTKIKEPAPNRWKCFTGSRIPPSPFLAVPHHVERPMMEMLTDDGQALVLDRLRLVRFKRENDELEREVIQAVLQEEVEPLTG